MYHEDKAQICRALVPVLQITRNLEDMMSLEYIKRGAGDEIVIATFQSGNDIGYNPTHRLKLTEYIRYKTRE